MLNPSEAAAVDNFANNQPGLTGKEKEVLKKMDQNKPLDSGETAIAANMLGRNLPAQVRNAVSHAVVDNIAANNNVNGNSAGNNSATGSGGSGVTGTSAGTGGSNIEVVVGQSSGAPVGGLGGGSVAVIEDPVTTDDILENVVAQTRRYLRIKNATNSNIKVYVQYRTLTESGDFEWCPADPDQSEQAATYRFAPGEEGDLFHRDWRMNASRVRIWAVADHGQEWDQFKAEDLWLVPELDADGERIYYAGEMETFPFTFSGGEE